MSKEGKSFWTTLPGILTGLAALLGAAGTLYVTLHDRQPEQSEKAGQLVLLSEDPGNREADVYVDEAYRGRPLEGEPGVRLRVENLKQGRHPVRITRSGYRDFDEDVAVFADEPNEVTFALTRMTGEPTVRTGGLLLVGENPAAEDAEVYLDGGHQGRIHRHGADLQLLMRSVAAGPHAVRVTKEDHEDFAQEIEVEPDRIEEVSVALARLETPPPQPPASPSSGTASGSPETAQPESPARPAGERPRRVTINPNIAARLPLARLFLAAPQQRSPRDGTRLDRSPRNLTLTWEPVTNAKTYTVEIQFCDPAGCDRSARPLKLQAGITGTSYAFTFVGPQPGRWRVWAVDASGRAGAKSPWRGFIFSR